MCSSSAGVLDRASRTIAAVSLLSILGWAVPALLMIDKGFSVQDEGSYLLSYRWWDSNPYFVSESQLFYGPVFAALDHDIAGLRVVRLAMAIASNAWFAWAFASWLERQRGRPIPLRRRTTIALLLTASGGATYLWSPLTPGYYDLTADATLALVALMLSMLARRSRASLVTPLLVGFLVVVLVLTRWSTIAVVLLTQAVVVGELLRSSPRRAASYVAMVVAGVAATTGLCHLLLYPLDRLVPALVRVSGLTAGGSHSTGFLVHTWMASTMDLALASIVVGLPLFAGYLAARRFARFGHQRAARACVLLGATVTGVLPVAVGWHGGSSHGRVMVGVVVAALLCAIVAASASNVSRPHPGRLGVEAQVIGVLLVVPVLQAAGTNVPWLYVAMECLAMWVAIVLVLISRRAPAGIAVFTVSTCLVVLVVAVALISGTTTLLTPFKTTGFDADTVPVAALHGVHLAPGVARQVAALRRALRPHVTPGVTPVLSLDELAGLTYELGGVPIGSTWNDEGDDRTAGILDLACRNGDVDPAREPIVIARQDPGPLVGRALRHCGFDFPSGYHRLVVPGGPPGVRVLVPTGNPQPRG